MKDLLRRRAGITIAVVIVLLLVFGNRIATFLTDLWWFDAVGYRGVFVGLLTTKIVLGLVGAALMGILVAANLQFARRMRPVILPATPQQAIVERYRQMAEPWIKWIIAGIAVLFGIASGASLSTQWEAFLLWQNGGAFGVADPQFGRDVGFFVFDLPFWRAVQQWLQFAVLMVGLLTAGAHYLLGGIRPELPRDRVLPATRIHLSLLLVAFLVVRGWGYWLDRFELNFSPRGQVTGASYTDVNAELPALNLLLVVTVVAIALILWSMRRQGFLLPGAAIGILIIGAIILQGIYPAAIQRFRVDPQELAQESEFIAKNMDATRAAWGIDEVDLRQFAVNNDLSQADLDNNQTTVDNVRLWDPSILQSTYAELQALRPYYQFLDVDVDRYVIDGELRQVMLGVRELDIAGLPAQAQTWQNERLTFTHGYGIVASQVNLTDDEGQPVFLAENIPPTGDEELVADARPGIYYGELTRPTYSIVDTDARELDYEEPGTLEQVPTVYDGEGGVSLGGRLKRLMWALRFSDTNFVISSLPRDDSRVLMHRNVQDRVRLVAPYLFLDADPYPVILDGRTVWVQDAYTASNNYPYSERADVGGTSINYIRNSVKAVVDAYDGTVTLYVVDDQDPIIKAWRRAFPEGYVDVSEAPEGLVEHFRYPETMFQLQAERYLTYHIPEAEAFYSKADEWQIPLDPSASASGEGTRRLSPFYLLMNLPGETQAEFVLIQPYLPANRPNMVAWLAARSDPGHYGKLFGVQFPSTQTILGPAQAQARIEQENVIAEYITLRDQAGSNVIRGNLLVVPIEDSILYIEPFFLESPQARIPELDRVVIVMGSRVAFEPTLDEALIALVSGAPPGEDEPDPSEDPDVLEERALEAFNDANQALGQGDLAEFQRHYNRALDLFQRAAELRGLDVPTEEPTEEPTDSPTGAGTPTTAPVSGR